MAPSDRSQGSVGTQIQALTARFHLPPSAATALDQLLWLLVEDPLAPTAIRDPWRVVDEHFADALVALDLSELQRASRVVDLGSGAGFPGLPLAIALPETAFTLLESSARKADFVERAVGAASVDNVEVVQSRAESFADGRDRFDVATARALAPLDVVAEYAAPLLRVNGSLIAWRGRRDPGAEADAARAAELLGMEVGKTAPVQPFPAARNRHLTLMSKVMDTPEGFPRRPGMAAKRPLGASDRPRR
jgi:16S rRNA (guanine527-N7)-methyltransferase